MSLAYSVKASTRIMND